MRRYYLDTLKKEHPDLVEPKPLEAPDLNPQTPPPPPRDPNEFSYNNALYETRVTVETMLADARQLKAAGKPAEAEAKIVEAENTMEERRQFISSTRLWHSQIEPGLLCLLRRLCRSTSGGWQRSTGPSVVALRAYSSSLPVPRSRCRASSRWKIC
jgi:hypothetical protein